MGYYSDVSIVIRGKEEFMLPQIASLNLTGDQHIQDALKEFCIMRASNNHIVLVAKFEGVKWYDSYPDVRAYDTIYRHFQSLAEDEKTPDLEGAFARVGEEINDTEEEAFGDFGYDLCRVYRSLECEYEPDETRDIRHNLSSLDEMKKTS